MSKRCLIILCTLTLVGTLSCSAIPCSDPLLPSVNHDFSISLLCQWFHCPDMASPQATTDRQQIYLPSVWRWATAGQVLTVLDYEDYTPGPLEVISPKYGTFNASVQAIDSRTSATLLKLESGSLPPARTGDASELQSIHDVFVKGWMGADSHYATLDGEAGGQIRY